MEHIRDIDFDKYHTFFLTFYKDGNTYDKHCIRPCALTYNEIEAWKKQKYKNAIITLDPVLLTFDKNEPISKIFIESAIAGINIDYVEILVKTDKSDIWSNHKCIQTIDTHKEDITTYFDQIEAPQYYIVKNKNINDVLKFMIVDRFRQDQKLDFLKGEYDKNCVIAGFNEHKLAKAYIQKLNIENKSEL